MNNSNNYDLLFLYTSLSFISSDIIIMIKIYLYLRLWQGKGYSGT